MSTKLWFETPTFYIIKNLVWIGIFVGLSFVVENYFIKKFKAENCGKQGKSNFVRVISALTPFLLVEAVLFNFIYE